uniref:Uncharacterized protein n=1 Tax=Oryza nivara TaxID=4536 RepID=A0A0E0IW18_ORYNI
MASFVMLLEMVKPLKSPIGIGTLGINLERLHRLQLLLQTAASVTRNIFLRRYQKFLLPHRVHDCDLLGRAHVELDVVADILLSRKPAPIGLVPVCSAVSASQVANPISQSSTPPMWFFNFNRNGPSGFSGASTAEEVTAGVDARGLAAVVTGASSGIGLETTRVLALRGVRVVLAVRNVAAGHKAREAIRAEIHGAIVHVLEMDLSSMDSVRRFASEFDSLNLPLNILINNAGILSKDCIRSIDGLELHFATNHIGHFLLTNLLLENMKSTSRTTGVEGRIINVSSSGHILTYPEGICFDSVKDLSRFSTYIAYGQSKLANILHSTELARILKGDGVNISANAIHPGFVGTNLFKNWTMANAVVNTIGRIVCKTVEQGAATTCYVALHPQVTGISGKYFSNCNLETPSSQASNAELAKKLWEFSSNIVSAAKLISEKTRARRLKKARHTSRRFPPFGSTTRTVSGLSFPAMPMATTKGARDGREGDVGTWKSTAPSTARRSGGRRRRRAAVPGSGFRAYDPPDPLCCLSVPARVTS